MERQEQGGAAAAALRAAVKETAGGAAGREEYERAVKALIEPESAADGALAVGTSATENTESTEKTPNANEVSVISVFSVAKEPTTGPNLSEADLALFVAVWDWQPKRAAPKLETEAERAERLRDDEFARRFEREGAERAAGAVLPPILLAASMAPFAGGLAMFAAFYRSLYERAWAGTFLVVPAALCFAAGIYLARHAVLSGHGKWLDRVRVAVRGAMVLAGAVAAALFFVGPGQAAASEVLDVLYVLAGAILAGSFLVGLVERAQEQVTPNSKEHTETS